jgi:hypothetical protein
MNKGRRSFFGFMAATPAIALMIPKEETPKHGYAPVRMPDGSIISVSLDVPIERQFSGKTLTDLRRVWPSQKVA